MSKTHKIVNDKDHDVEYAAVDNTENDDDDDDDAYSIDSISTDDSDVQEVILCTTICNIIIISYNLDSRACYNIA